MSTPHLFTHLFHHGVIVSTRKLDYDAGSAEDSIRSLMQAQHKAVLKDLRRGVFDDKIDSYLGGTPGLLPRGAEDAPDRSSEAELASSSGAVMDMASGPPTDQMLPVLDDASAPMEKTPVPVPVRGGPAIPPVPARPAERRGTAVVSRASARGGGPATDPVLATQRTPAPAFDHAAGDLSPEIEIQLGDDARPERRTRDTETQLAVPARGAELEEQTRPTLGIPDDGRRSTISDLAPGGFRTPSAIPLAPGDARRPGDRPSTINAATLPPARPISRPASRPALAQPQVVSRPLPQDERGRRDSEAVEVYSPAPPSAELPGNERTSQYTQHRKSGRIPLEGIKAERSGAVSIPAGLGRPQRPATSPIMKPAGAPPIPAPAPAAPPARAANHTEPLRNRVSAPARVPVTSRTTTATGGVVMTRPAVIVGAPHTPQKTANTVPRIRKAREDEGRGFGQGLISEKSLDEVILAYLSEDADDK